MAGLAVGLSVATLRAWPVMCAWFASRSLSTLDKLTGLLAYLALVFMAVRYTEFDVLPLMGAYAMVALASLGPYWLAGRVPPPVLLGLTVGLFLVLPTTAPFAGLALLLGWDLVMSTYSYGAEVPASRRALRDYVFFILVDPTLVYSKRAQRIGSAGCSWQGVKRVLTGFGSLTLSGALGSHLSVQERLSGHPVLEALTVAARVASLYLAHTGLASFQIGLMRVLGYTLPERYDRPFAACSPAEFWHRWNTYLGAWARRYVFTPLMRHTARTAPSVLHRWRPAVYAGGVVATFAVVGMLHDAYVTARGLGPTLGMTLWFIGNGVLLAAWQWVVKQPPRADLTRRSLLRSGALAALASLSAALLP